MANEKFLVSKEIEDQFDKDEYIKFIGEDLNNKPNVLENRIFIDLFSNDKSIKGILLNYEQKISKSVNLDFKSKTYYKIKFLIDAKTLVDILYFQTGVKNIGFNLVINNNDFLKFKSGNIVKQKISQDVDKSGFIISLSIY